MSDDWDVSKHRCCCLIVGSLSHRIETSEGKRSGSRASHACRFSCGCGGGCEIYLSGFRSAMVARAQEQPRFTEAITRAPGVWFCRLSCGERGERPQTLARGKEERSSTATTSQENPWKEKGTTRRLLLYSDAIYKASHHENIPRDDNAQKENK